jgi:hypothetical protein
MCPRRSVKQVHRHQRRLGVIREDVRVATFRGGHFLFFAHFFHGAQYSCSADASS